MEIGKAFTFVTDDDSWIKKLAIGAIFVLVPFLILLVIGYQILIIRNVIDGKDRPLPEWEDFGKLFIDGLIMVVAIFIYALPIILLSLCGAVIGATTTDAAGSMSPGGGIGVALLSCLAILFGIALAFIGPALYIQYARYGEFGRDDRRSVGQPGGLDGVSHRGEAMGADALGPLGRVVASA